MLVLRCTDSICEHSIVFLFLIAYIDTVIIHVPELMLLGGDVAKGGSSGEKPFQVREGGGHVKLVHP